MASGSELSSGECERFCTRGASIDSPALLLSMMLASLGGCSLDKTPIGDDALDELRLSKTAAAAYLPDALVDGDVTLGTLVERGADLRFRAAPDPTLLERRMSAMDDARARTHKATVPILTYNVALLDAQIFGVIPYEKSPYLEERRDALPSLILDGTYDVVCAQEIWKKRDLESFTSYAHVHGYRVFAQPRTSYDDGVAVFVKESAINGGTIPELADAEPYASQDWTEYFPGPRIKRGFLEVAFDHRDAGPMRVFCTHMQAWPQSWPSRMHQARELGIAARTHSKPGELVVVAGDFNAGPFYASDAWQKPDGSTFTGWFGNALSDPVLMSYGDLVDAAVVARPSEDAASDVTLGKTVVNDPKQAAKVPGAKAGWCERLPKTTFTALDCNSLYFEQYAGTEFPARIDHVYVRDRPDLVVAKSALVFTEKERFGDVVVEPSDHMGVAVDILVDAVNQL